MIIRVATPAFSLSVRVVAGLAAVVLCAINLGAAAAAAAADASIVEMPPSSTTAAAGSVPAPLPDPKIIGRKCNSRKGVTVVVDFRDLQNDAGRRMNLVKIGCARGAPDNGLAAIVAAGFELQHRSGLVCRLDERPLPEQTDCVSEGYWSYWHGVRGAAWEYSDSGAGGWVPPRGSLEGWAWNWYDRAEAAPRVAPDDLYPPLPAR